MKEFTEEQRNAEGTLHSAVDPLALHQKLQPRGKQFANKIPCFQLPDLEQRILRVSVLKIKGQENTQGREMLHTKQKSDSYLSSHSPAAGGPVVTSQNGGLNKKKGYN